MSVNSQVCPIIAIMWNNPYYRYSIKLHRNIRVYDIMAITGHKDYDSFSKYYRLDKIKVHETFHAAWSNIKPKYDIGQIIKNLLAQNVDVKVIASSFGIEAKEIDLISRN